MMLKLKLQYFAYLLQREDTLGEKNPDAGKDLRQEDRGEHEMFGWHHRLNGPEYEQTLRDGEGQGSLASCGPWAAGVGHD